MKKSGVHCVEPKTMSSDEGTMKYMEELFGVPLFKMGFFAFFKKMQQEGIEAAERFWSLYPGRNLLSPRVPEIFEKLIDFYTILGFVPGLKYNEALEENEKLKKEEEFLRDIMREFQTDISTSAGKQIREACQITIDKQLEMNRERAEDSLELVRQLKGELVS